MLANPGGTVDPADCIGRDNFIARIWQALATQSLVLVAERRMGKTTILKKMASRPLGKRLVIFRDVENISEPIEFVQRVYQDVESYLSKRKKTASKAQAILQQLGGAKALGFTFPEAAAPQYKALLESILGDLAQTPNQKWCYYGTNCHGCYKKLSKIMAMTS